MRMRRGTIVIRGPAKDFTGLQMKGGTIVLMSGAEIRTGAWMNRGTIISLKPLQMMPTFAYTKDQEPTFLSDLARELKEFGITCPPPPRTARSKSTPATSRSPTKARFSSGSRKPVRSVGCVESARHTAN